MCVLTHTHTQEEFLQFEFGMIYIVISNLNARVRQIQLKFTTVHTNAMHRNDIGKTEPDLFMQWIIQK